MHLVADFHLHSKYSRAVSQKMILSYMTDVAIEKGIHLLTASDFTHPLWFKEIQTQLEEAGEGVYSLREKRAKNDDEEVEPRFILSTEISCIYTQDGRLRRIHNLVFAPSLEVVEKINTEMKKRGFNLSADGRPIIGLSSRNLLEMVLGVDESCMLVPCHVWTPHFGLYGSASGFDSIEEAFGDMSKHIYAVETGLSSDPEMNWQIPELTNRSILSFSDAHSAAKMGREATIFVSRNQDVEFKIQDLKYDDICSAVKRDPKSRLKVGYTVEFYPEEGKYHFSGHRSCKASKSPEDIEKTGIACPVCGKKMTEGVFVRLKHLSGDKVYKHPLKKENTEGLVWYTDPSKHHPPFVKLVPLLEIVAESLDSTPQSIKTQNLYSVLVKTFGSEFEVLLRTPVSQIATRVHDKVAQGIGKVRRGDIAIQPGYDGEYGVVKIWEKGKDRLTDTDESSQLSLEL